jgi:dTDP-4-amino-4,6-dideoxygalactose transaminase
VTLTNIPITKPVLGAEELEALRAPIEAGWVVQGPQVAQFERRFAEYCGAPHAVASTSCTTALHLVLAALGLGPGDEVIVPAFTWVSTANVVEYQGATPVFADVELTTFNIDPDAFAAAITERTVGVIPVHLFGLCAEMAPILEIAERHGLWVLEDAACAFGAFYRGASAGMLGTAGAFSFHPRKSITTGEGGMVTTADDALARKVAVLRDHGASRTDLSRHVGRAGFLLADYDDLGFNYRMTDLQGAMGCVQMDRAPWILEQRARVAATYSALLADVDWIRPPIVPHDGHVHGWQSYVALFAPEEPTVGNVEELTHRRNAVMMRLEEQGIATRQGTHAPVGLGYYSRKYDLRMEHFPGALLSDRLSLSLPLYPQLTDDDIERVVAALREAVEER